MNKINVKDTDVTPLLFRDEFDAIYGIISAQKSHMHVDGATSLFIEW